MGVIDDFAAGDGELAADVEEVVLGLLKHGAEGVVGSECFDDEDADLGVEFVHGAHGFDAQAVLAIRPPSARPVVPSSPVRV